jgi:uncharacterized membrane-anchored protein/uncharacterized membrane protein
MSISVQPSVAKPDFWNEAQETERVAAYIGPLLAGFGLIVWLAANWDGFGRYGRFCVAGAALAISVVGALALTRARPGFLLIAFLSVGGLLALIGQTYQTGADPWSLFAIWAVLTLPFALAARSDAVWSGWVIVAMAAITLWVHNTGGGLLSNAVSSAQILAAWAGAFGLTILFSPCTPVRAWLGSTTWAWRIGLLLAASQVTLLACAALFSRGHSSIYLGGLGLLAAMAGLILTRRPFDIVAAAIIGIAVDTALITGVVRVVFGGRSNAWLGSTLLTGLVAAGIVAGTATILLKWWKADSPTSGPSHNNDDTPWPIIALSAFGALVASIPLLFFYILFAWQIGGERIMQRGPAIGILGALTLGGALLMLRRPGLGHFAETFSLIFAFVGFLQLGFVALRDMPLARALGLLALAAAVLAFVLPQRWIALLLGAVAAILAWLALSMGLLGGSKESVLGLLYITGRVQGSYNAWAGHLLQIADAVLILGGLALLMRNGNTSNRVQSFATGWLSAAVIGKAWQSGHTFMLGAFWGAGGATTLPAGVASGLHVAPFLVAVLGLALLFTRRPEFRRPLLLAFAGVLLALAAMQPLLGSVIVVGAVTLAEGRRRLTLLAGLAALWIIGAYYYALSLPLMQKGLILMGLGLALGLVTLGVRLKSAGQRLAPSTQPLSFTGAPALIAFGALAIAGLAGWSIWDKERILRDGRMVMLRIAPVDPRSLLQGDYMTLSFDLPQRRASPADRQPGGPQPVAIGTVGPDNVAKIDEIALKRPAITQSQIVIALDVKNSNYVVGSDAWFFKEGDSKKWEGARYGIFRVTSDGTALLAGLADEKLQPIR